MSMKNAKVSIQVVQKTPAYKNPKLPSAKRAQDLLKRMTLEEKAAQMLCIWQQKAETLVDANGNFDLQKAKKAFHDRRGLGQVGRPSDAGGGKGARAMAELTNDIQRFFLENSRLGIPVIFHEECLHGHAAPEGTSFPQPIALGATFNPELVERLFTMTALEARSRGAHHALTRWSMWLANPVGGALKKPTAKIPTLCRGSELPRSAGSRAIATSVTNATCWLR